MIEQGFICGSGKLSSLEIVIHEPISIYMSCIDLHVPHLLSGSSYNEIGKSPTLRFRATKTMKVFCRVSVQNDENITVDSKQVTIIPELGMCISVIMESKFPHLFHDTVWITSQLTQTGHYYGKRVDIKCTAEKHSSVVGKMR